MEDWTGVTERDASCYVALKLRTNKLTSSLSVIITELLEFD